MDRSEARRAAKGIVLAASTQPDYRFTDDQFMTYGADGPDGARALMSALVEVAKGLGAQPTEANPVVGDVAAINRVVASCRAQLEQRGGDPSAHLNAVGR